jgi:hypothetical protein
VLLPLLLLLPPLLPLLLLLLLLSVGLHLPAVPQNPRPSRRKP